VDATGTATVAVDDGAACLRTYTLSTTAELRDGLPANPRVFAEQAGWPTVRTGHELFDALYALALEETRENSVEWITDGGFNHGAPVPCGVAGGCFETGRKWTYVWTRDTAYATHLGLAGLDPTRARNSLEFKLAERRGGGDLQIVQDTGSGGSYPVSSDRVTWALGAEATLAHLVGDERTAFGDRAYEALINTIDHDRAVVFDPADGLYRGEQSFLDWREQTYPGFTAADVVPIAGSKALSTNVAHLAALRLAASLAGERGETARRDEAQAWADALRTAIRTRLWLVGSGQFSTYVPNELDPAPVDRFDLLGASLAILLDVADPVQAASMLSGYPHYGPGAPVAWPQQQFVPIYHNRGEWPFVTAYWLRAAAHAGHDAVATRMIRALVRGAALNLSNMENFEAGSGAPWLDEGATSGPVVNSQRQLWSVAGYVSMVHQSLFGLSPQSAGLRVRPFVPAEIRTTLFAGTNELVLNDVPIRGRRVNVVLALPDDGGTGALTVEAITVDGAALSGDLVPDAMLVDGARIDVVLGPGVGPATSLIEVGTADYRDVFGPRTPVISAIDDDAGNVRLSFDLGGEMAGDVTLRVWRDGILVADALPGSTTVWTDPASDTMSAASPCYALESVYASGNHSQHSAPACWWGAAASHITTLDASTFAAVGGTGVTNWGRFHYEGWGGPGDSLTTAGFTPTTSGRHWLQVLYGNGAGAVNTGITCAVKRVTVEEVAGGATVGQGILVMPHLGSWDRWEDSNLVPISLTAGVEVRVRIDDDPGAANMSEFRHFESYTGGNGGVGGAYDDVNIAEVRVLQAP
jgi:hypothetical protein